MAGEPVLDSRGLVHAVVVADQPAHGRTDGPVSSFTPRRARSAQTVSRSSTPMVKQARAPASGPATGARSMSSRAAGMLSRMMIMSPSARDTDSLSSSSGVRAKTFW
jgi:hypothetical protein